VAGTFYVQVPLPGESYTAPATLGQTFTSDHNPVTQFTKLGREAQRWLGALLEDAEEQQGWHPESSTQFPCNHNDTFSLVHHDNAKRQK
jgi:hypothetical protein